MAALSTNRPLTIAVIIDPPAAMDCALEKVCPNRGIVFEMAEIMCKKLNFTCTFVNANTTTYGYSENGTWLGVVGQIASGLADTSLPRFTPTEQRSEVIDFSSPVFYEDFLLVTRQPESNTSDNKLDLIHAFDWYVWLCILGVLILASCIMSDTIMFKTRSSALEKYCTKKLNPTITFCGKYVTIWIISLVALTLARAYTGYLFTKHVGANLQKPFTDLRSFADCLKTKTCSLSVKPGTVSYIHQLMDANESSDFSTLKMALDQKPLQTYQLEELIDDILKDKSSFTTALIWDTDFYYASSEYDSCQFYVIPAALLPGPNTFPLPKKSPYRRELDLLANEFNEFGFIKKIKSKYKVTDKGPCRQVMSAEGDSLAYLENLFVFLLIGETVAVLCFCLERIVARRKYDNAIDSVSF